MARRFSPFVLQNNIYQCRAWFHAVSVDISPGFLRSLLLFSGLFLLFWIGSRLLFVFYRVRRLKKQLFIEKLLSSEVCLLLQRLGLDRVVFFVKSEQLFSFCFGFIHPKIYISTYILEIMDKNEMEAILLHEKHHLDHKDPLVMFVAFFVELLFPFFPVISDLLVHYRLMREIRADQFAVTTLGDASQLVSVLRKMLTASTYFVSGSAPLVGDMLETRIKFLTRTGASFSRMSLSNILISLFSLALLFLLLITPVHAANTVSQQRNILFCSTTVKASLPFSWAIDK